MERRRKHREAETQADSHAQPERRDAEESLDGARRLSAAQFVDEGRAAGPFRPEINAALAHAFDRDVSHLSATFGDAGSTRALGAVAYTHGPHMVFDPQVREDARDARSMEVIGHEVAHALGAPGTRAGVDRAGDASEHGAAETGRRFADWTSGGQLGVAPALQPVAGTAAVHRMSVGGPGGVKDPVHEALTIETLIQAGVVPPGTQMWDPATVEYLRGVYWNDDPESLQFRDKPAGAHGHGTGEAHDHARDHDGDHDAHAPGATGIRWALRFLFGDRKRNLTARSHHGDLQFLHAMASQDGEPPEVTKGNAGLWAKLTIDVALAKIPGETQVAQTAIAALFPGELGEMSLYHLFGLKTPDAGALRQRAIGSLLHLVQDSHAQGHTERNARGEIVEFHSYTSQDHGEHGEFDNFHGDAGVDSVPGGRAAIDHGARLLKLIQQGDADVALAYVLDEVLKLAPDVRPAGPGEHLHKRREKRLDPPAGFSDSSRHVDERTTELVATLLSADGTPTTFFLHVITEDHGGERWILWKQGKWSAVAYGQGIPSTARLYLDINPALGHPAGTLP